MGPQALVYLPERLPQQRWIHPIRDVADLTVTGYLFDAKQTLGVILPFAPLHVPLVGQKRWGLHEKDGERRQPRFLNLVPKMVAPPVFWDLGQAILQDAQHLFELRSLAHLDGPPLI